MISETITNLLVNALTASPDDQPVRVQVGYDTAGTTVIVATVFRMTSSPEFSTLASPQVTVETATA